jgi:GntR family transcriptional regulator
MTTKTTLPPPAMAPRDAPWRDELSLEPERVSPLHHQIKENIRRQIVSGRWRTNHPLPSETELCDHFGVSRGTLRRALGDLEHEGLIVRRQGRGTFVSQPKFEGSVLGSYRNYRVGAVPHDATSRLLGIDRIPASPDIQRLLQLGKRERVYEVRRLQFMEGVPITLSTSFIPAALAPGLDKLDLEHELFYGLLEQRYGFAFLRAEEFLEPVIADDVVARHLDLAPGSAVFLVARRSFLVNDRPGEYRQAYARGDRFRYRIELR